MIKGLNLEQNSELKQQMLLYLMFSFTINDSEKTIHIWIYQSTKRIKTGRNRNENTFKQNLKVIQKFKVIL